jgi:hypothetical protein
MAQGHEFREDAGGGSRELAFSAWFRHGFGVRLCCFQAHNDFQQLNRRNKLVVAGTEGEGVLMNLTTLSTIAMLVNPTTVRVTAGILCAVCVVIIVMRRKKMASKRRPIP